MKVRVVSGCIVNGGKEFRVNELVDLNQDEAKNLVSLGIVAEVKSESKKSNSRRSKKDND